MPVEPAWTLALNNALTAPPAYDGTLAFFPIEGDRLVAYDLVVRRADSGSSPPAPRCNRRPATACCSSSRPRRSRRCAPDDGSIAWELPLAEPLAVRPVWDNGWLVVSLTSGEIPRLPRQRRRADLAARPQVARARPSRPRRRPRLRADRRSSHRRLARGQWRAAVGAQAGRRRRTTSSRSTTACMPGRRTTSSTA